VLVACVVLFLTPVEVLRIAYHENPVLVAVVVAILVLLVILGLVMEPREQPAHLKDKPKPKDGSGFGLV